MHAASARFLPGRLERGLDLKTNPVHKRIYVYGEMFHFFPPEHKNNQASLTISASGAFVRTLSMPLRQEAFAV